MNNLDNHYLSSRDCINASPAVDGGGVAGHGGGLEDLRVGGHEGPPGVLDMIDVQLREQLPRLVERVERRMGPAAEEDESVVMEDEAGTGLGAGIGPSRERSPPGSVRKVELPEVVEG